MLRALDDLIERRIAQAQREGGFDRLPGAGRPLVIDEQPLVPEEVRAAYRVLRNAGLVPPEVDQMRERAGLPPADPTRVTSPTKMLALTETLERRGVVLSRPGLAAYAGKLRQGWEKTAQSGSKPASASLFKAPGAV